MTLAQKLAALRKNAGLNMSELAEKVGVSRSLISKYEKGERMPGREALVLLSEFYGVSIDALLGTGASHSVEFEVNGGIADRLKELRKKRNVSQVELARAVHVNQSSVSQWETGRTAPGKDCLLLLAEFFHVSVDYLLGKDPVQPEAIDFVETLEHILKEKNISKKQMLSDLNLAINSFVNWKKRGNTPNGETLLRIAAYLDISVNELLGEEKSTATVAQPSNLTEQEEILLQHFRGTTGEGRFRMIAAILEIEKELSC